MSGKSTRNESTPSANDSTQLPSIKPIAFGTSEIETCVPAIDPVSVHGPLPTPQPPPDSSAAVVAHLASIAEDIKRIADHLVPPPSAYMGSPELAQRLDCTPTWVAEMARDGRIPRSCIVVGTGGSKRWKFHRAHIEKWLASR